MCQTLTDGPQFSSKFYTKHWMASETLSLTAFHIQWAKHYKHRNKILQTRINVPCNKNRQCQFSVQACRIKMKMEIQQ